jgi:hypothetical protein
VELGDRDIDKAISARAVTPARALEAVRRAAVAVGFEAEQTAPNTLRLTGPVRPSWCVAVAGLFAIPTLGLSLFLLRIRTVGVATATLADGAAGLHVHLFGPLPEETPTVVAQLLAHPQFADADAGVPPETFAPLTTASEPAPAMAAPARKTSEWPINDVPLALSHNTGDINATVARPRFVNLTPGAPRLTFDGGLSVTVHSFALIGRAPAAEEGDPPAQLLPIADPDLSVSKTHLACGLDSHGFWVCDRHSTNGSAITNSDGVKIRCIPGQHHYVASGSTVHVGDRSFSVVMSSTTARRSG